MKWQHALVLIVLCFTSITAMCKNPVLKNTSWVAVQEMFVADVGTMTITHTLEFVSDKDVVVKEVTVMPSHPAMYEMHLQLQEGHTDPHGRGRRLKCVLLPIRRHFRLQGLLCRRDARVLAQTGLSDNERPNVRAEPIMLVKDTRYP